MKKLFLFFISLITLFCSTRAQDEVKNYFTSFHKVGVAILDGPFDLAHPNIHNVLDSDLMKEVSITDEDGKEKSWHEINEEVRKLFQTKINGGSYKSILDFIDALSILNDELSLREHEKNEGMIWQIYKKAFTGAIRYIFFPDYRRQLNLVSRYIHGTHVAGMAVNGIDDIRLVTIPLFSLPKHMRLSEILDFNAEVYREKVKRNLQFVSNSLKRGNIRVVNFSGASSERDRLESLNESVNFFTKIFYKKKLQDIAAQKAKVFASEFKVFVQDNPQSVFVVAVGNEGGDLSEEKYHTAKIKTSNIVKVGAIERSGLLTSFSNYSSEFVDVAAAGIAIKSSLVDGRSIHMTGTSQAVSRVTNSLVEVFQKSPEISSENAIDRLYSLTKRSLALSYNVKNGRSLISSPEYIEKEERVYRESVNLSRVAIPSNEVFREVYNETLSRMEEFGFRNAEVLYAFKGVSLVIQYIKKENGKILSTVKTVQGKTLYSMTQLDSCNFIYLKNFH